ncbi:MAG: hypothetical protein LW855_01805 [Alphaproteobacteria bacterium]|nr:hypothetical protein [Alphaproteobacteria bacterium]
MGKTVLVVGCWLLLFSSLAIAAPQLRVGEHPGYGRIALDWNDPASSASVSAEGATVTVHSPAGLPPQLEKLERRLPQYVSGVTLSGDTATLTLKPGVTITRSTVRTATVVDFRKTADKADKTAAKKDTAPVTAPPPVVAATPEAAPVVPAATASVTPPVAAPQVVALKKESAKQEPAPAPLTPKEEVQPVKPAAEIPAMPQPVPQAAPIPALPGQPLVLTMAKGANSLTIRFPFTEPAAAAVFSRAGYIWAVFDRLAPLDFGGIRTENPDRLELLEQRTHPRFTVVRLKTAVPLAPSLWPQGNTWNLDLRPEAISVEHGLLVRAEPNAAPTPRVELLLPHITEPGLVSDPSVGDNLWIAPARSSGHGNQDTLDFQEFSVLASGQGIVIVPGKEDMSVRGQPDKVVITSATGLRLTAQEPPAGLISDELPRDAALFDFSAWRRGPVSRFTELRQQLQDAVNNAPRSQKNPRRMDLARFLFSHGYLTEAGGVVGTMVREEPTLQNNQGVAALRGAIALLDDDPLAAKAAFSDPFYQQNPEGQLWLGAAYASLGDTKTAAGLFESSRALPSSYPARHAVVLASLAAESLLSENRTALASVFLDDVSVKELTRSQKKRVEFLQARVMAARGDTPMANSIFKELSQDGDQWARTRAELELINTGLADGSLSRKDAIVRLERLRFAWRGDIFEFSVLRKLADMYMAESEYRKGLRLLRQISSRFAAHPDKAVVDKTISDTFSKLYLDGAADALSPLTALALYDEFRDLTPKDAAGDQMIRNLADRLVAVDLLDRAADLLDHQVRERLSGIDRARVGAQLALIKLLDRNPDAAIQALDSSGAPDVVAPELLANRTRLRARALMMKEDFGGALALLESGTAEPDLRLRCEIYWAQKDYTRLVATLRQVINVTGKEEDVISPIQARTILNLALALSLAQQYNDLAALQTQYAKVMEKTELAGAFAIIARAPADTDITSYRDVSRQFAEIKNFESFLEVYKQKLKEGKLSAL